MTKSEEFRETLKKYNKTEYVTDRVGRLIGVRRLRPSQQLLVEEMAPGLTGTTPVRDDESGETYEMPRISSLVMAASVVEMDGNLITFPKSRGELNAILDTLDRPGLEAVAEGLAKLASEVTPADTTGIEAAKN